MLGRKIGNKANNYNCSCSGNIYVSISAIVILFMALTACGATFESNVSIFHNLPHKFTRTKYAFLRLKGQRDSLEHKSYEDLLRNQFRAIQFQEVKVSDAEVIVILSYGIDGGKQKIGSVPIFGQTGVSSAQTFGNAYSYGGVGTYSGTTTYTPTYGIVGASSYSYTVHTRRLNLDIYRKGRTKQEKMEKIYE